MTRIACITANLGGYDNAWPWVPQVVSGAEVSVHRFTDDNFPPRPKAMTSALQVGLLKWFGFDIVPNADIYLWVDASCALLDSGCAQRWIDRLGHAELAVFTHPDRSSIQEEYRFMAERLARPGERYLTSRYEGEWLASQYAEIAANPVYVDNRLFATTAFMYRPSSRIRALFQRVWLGKTRWHLHDQLWFAYCLGTSDVTYNAIQDRYTACDLLTYVRNRKTTA